MDSHAPENYVCPFCMICRGEFGKEGLHTVADDVVLQNESVIAFIASHWWPNNPGHVLIIPRIHIENMYDLPKKLAAEIHEAARRIAIAMKQAYQCPGISTRQHNEPAGNQEIWHYHLHVFPRFPEDQLYQLDGLKQLASEAQRSICAGKLLEWLGHLG